MKKILLFSAVLLLASTAVNAQASIWPLLSVPQGINYQAVARGSDGRALANTAVSFRISILQGSATGPSKYTETHNKTTDANGLVNLVVLRGTYVSGDANLITWFQNGPYFLQVEMDRAGGSAYQLMGTSELLSVPYSLFSGVSISAFHAGPYYKVGDRAEGGVVIATWDGGRHGWVAALKDMSRNTNWFAGVRLIEADTTGGYRDWVLPNMAQLRLMYEKREAIGSFTSDLYWSSSVTTRSTDVPVHNGPTVYYDLASVLGFTAEIEGEKIGGVEMDFLKNNKPDQSYDVYTIGVRPVRVF